MSTLYAASYAPPGVSPLGRFPALLLALVVLLALLGIVAHVAAA